MQKHNIAIIGASGYTGVELIRLLHNHPAVNIKALGAHNQAGLEAAQVFHHLSVTKLPKLQSVETIDFSDIEIVFCCLPHATSQQIIKNLPPHLRIIDLSADFRLRDASIYKKWYGHTHIALELQQNAVYGLSEHYRNQIKHARLVANPGCYPTCALLPLIPLLANNLLNPDGLIIDAKSGISGAGRSVAQHLLYNEISEGFSPYNVNQHRHIGEIEQEINAFSNSLQNIIINFVPHLVPMRRGMICTIYAKLQNGVTFPQARDILTQRYEDEAFIHVLPANITPSTHQVRGSNHTTINIFQGSDANQIILIAAIDNLMKGASGQAVQNMNIMLGLSENTALEAIAMFP
jgi:N-acetyl-gamma-glutamyl-phosphate reductase